MNQPNTLSIKIILIGVGVGLLVGLGILALLKKPWEKSHPEGCTEKIEQIEIAGACPEE